MSEPQDSKLFPEAQEEKSGATLKPEPFAPSGCFAPETYIYLMKNTRTGFIKIGRSNNPVQRLSQLRLTEPQIILMDALKAGACWERELHERFGSVRVGGEWFALEESHLQAIRCLFQKKRDRDRCIKAAEGRG